jgi:hypothetical protein
MKRLGVTNQELNGFSIDEDLDELDQKDKFEFGIKDDTSNLDENNGLKKIEKNKLKSIKVEVEVLKPTPEKVTGTKSILNNQKELQDPSLKLSSNFKETINHKLNETPSILVTSPFMGKEIIEEIKTFTNISNVFKEAIDVTKRDETPLYSDKNLKVIAKEALNAPQINYEANEKAESTNTRKKSVTLEDDLKNTTEYVNQLQEDYKKILWEKEKMDEEMEKEQNTNGLENAQIEEKKSIETTTTLIEEASGAHDGLQPVISDALKKHMVPKANVLENLDQIINEPQKNQIQTELDTKSSTNNGTNSSNTSEAKSSNTFSIK